MPNVDRTQRYLLHDRTQAVKERVLKPLRFQDSLWSYWPDSNRRPADYESAALPTEPQ